MMMKIFKPFIKLIKFLYSLIDKYIVIPISRLVYRINELTRNNSGKIERILNRPKCSNLCILVLRHCCICSYRSKIN